MAKITFPGLDEYAKELGQLEAKSSGIIRYSVYPAAQIALQAVKANTPVDSGDLKESEALTKFQDKNGYVYTQIVFPGYDGNGTPNSIKARVLESGSSKQKKTPFIRPAIKAVEARVVETMKQNLDAAIKAAMNGGK